jgi:hypothetical protein
MIYNIKLELGTGDVEITVTDVTGSNIILLAEAFNNSANCLANSLQGYCSDSDASKLRKFFGETMGTIISGIILPIEDTINKVEK